MYQLQWVCCCCGGPRPHHPNSWKILWVWGCQIIHMSSFWDLEWHQGLGQRPQPWSATVTLSAEGGLFVWVGFCFGFVHRCWWGCGWISGAPDTPPLRHGSQRPLVKMMRLLFLILDLRTDVVKHLTIGSRSVLSFRVLVSPSFLEVFKFDKNWQSEDWVQSKTKDRIHLKSN